MEVERGSKRNFGAPEIVGALQDEISRLIAEACSASAVWVSLANAPTRVPLDAEGGSDSDAGLLAELRRFVDRQPIDTAGNTIGGILPFATPGGDTYIFIQFPLRTESDTAGMAGVAIDLAKWTGQQVFHSLHQIGAIAGLMLVNACDRLRLQTDLAEMKGRADRLARLAEIDEETGLDTKIAFERKAEEHLLQRQAPMVLLSIGLDDGVCSCTEPAAQLSNDALRTLGDVLRHELPDGALAGRIGPDEVLALIDVPSDRDGGLDLVLRRIQAALPRSMARLGTQTRRSVSIGVCPVPDRTPKFAVLQTEAILALHAARRAKTAGRPARAAVGGGVQVASASTLSPMTEDLSAYFQPIVDITTGRTAGLEVLARWIGPDADSVRGPTSFGWMFKDTRFAAGLTSRILRNALTSLHTAGRGHATRGADLWINVTEHDLRHRGFVGEVSDILRDHHVSWEQVVIEVNETCMLGSRDGQLSISLAEMRTRGGRVALDDFGTGYAGLAHIPHWPIDILKIDRTFIGDLGHCAKARAIVEAITLIAMRTGLRVVAEGVETEVQFSQLRQLGCDYVQGFLLSPPCSAAALATCPTVFDICQPRLALV